LPRATSPIPQLHKLRRLLPARECQHAAEPELPSAIDPHWSGRRMRARRCSRLAYSPASILSNAALRSRKSISTSSAASSACFSFAVASPRRIAPPMMFRMSYRCMRGHLVLPAALHKAAESQPRSETAFRRVGDSQSTHQASGTAPLRPPRPFANAATTENSSESCRGSGGTDGLGGFGRNSPQRAQSPLPRDRCEPT
jgi:hypothetical protein